MLIRRYAAGDPPAFWVCAFGIALLFALFILGKVCGT
jgi:hypothetical protein